MGKKIPGSENTHSTRLFTVPSTFELARFDPNPTCTALKPKKPNSNQFKNPIARSPTLSAASSPTKTTPTSTDNGTSRDLHGARLGTLEVRRSLY
uniref:hypothetical protein n=1 Tax=Trichocoleus desertorum TaxID=1481672 RepID=UPI0025B33D5B|nr:hypothetical protein [Trichocoleus desertorum]